MPRKGRGSKALDAGRPLPDNPVPKQEYGEAAKQSEAMKAVPMQALPDTFPKPGELHWDQHPGDASQPITHGAPIGEGPGPEALAPVGQEAHAATNIAEALAYLASGPNSSPELKDLARFARLGQ